jgi:hypothetical protein
MMVFSALILVLTRHDTCPQHHVTLDLDQSATTRLCAAACVLSIHRKWGSNRSLLSLIKNITSGTSGCCGLF